MTEIEALELFEDYRGGGGPTKEQCDKNVKALVVLAGNGWELEQTTVCNEDNVLELVARKGPYRIIYDRWGFCDQYGDKIGVRESYLDQASLSDTLKFMKDVK